MANFPKRSSARNYISIMRMRLSEYQLRKPAGDGAAAPRVGCGSAIGARVIGRDVQKAFLQTGNLRYLPFNTVTPSKQAKENKACLPLRPR